jgi:hypothetical protein
MDQAAKTHIRNVMANLAETRPEVLDYPTEEIDASRWMSGSYDNFIVQCELLHHRNEGALELFDAGRQWPVKNAFFDGADA